MAHRLTTALAITGAIAGSVLTGSDSPAAADAPPGIPTVTVTLTPATATRASAIRVDYEVCDGCDLVASWNYGGASAYPTTYPPATGPNFTDFGSTSPGIIPVAGDELTYHLSFFAETSVGALSAPAEWSLNVPEWTGGLAPDPTITAKGSNELAIQVDAGDGNIERRYRTRVYVRAGKHPPGSASTLPKGKPLLECIVGKCKVDGDGFINLTVHKVSDVGYYSVSTYGTDRAGHRRRLTKTAYVGHDGQHVSGLGRVPGAIGDGASMAVDKNGTVHAITPRAATSEFAATAHLNYLTRKAKAKKWTSTSFTLTEDGGGAVVQSGISSDHTGYWTVFQTCAGLYAAETKISATTLGTRTKFAEGGTCALNTPQPADRPARSRLQAGADPGSSDDPEDLVGTTTLPGDQIGVLGIDSFGVGVVSTMLPGQPATVAPLLGSGLTTVPQAITRDPVTGELVVAGDQISPTGDTTGFVLWTQQPGQPWSNPEPINQPITGRASAVVTSVVADNGNIMIGIDGAPTGKTSGVYTAVGTENGVWTLGRVAHSSVSANYLRLALDASTKKVHAAYDVTTGLGGIREQSWSGRTWSPPTLVSSFHEDLPEALVVGPAHHSVVLYECDADTIVHVDDTNTPGYS